MLKLSPPRGSWLPCLLGLALPLSTRAAPPAPVALEEVTVTARHRPEAARDVPIALTVLDGEALAAAGLYRLQDIQERVPGLVVSGHNERFAGFGLRGFGATAYNDGLDPSVGTFIDGVYLGRQGMAFAELLDIERIEVLRGPQGTLFGKNTSAGAVNIVTRQPSFQTQAEAEARFGDYGTRQYRANLSGPVLDGVLAGRLSVFDSERDGLVENLEDGGNLNALNSQGVRGQLLWAPNEDFSLRLIGERGQQEQHGNVLLNSQYSRETRQRAAFNRYPLLPSDPYRREIRLNDPVSSETVQDGLSLETNWALNPDHRLTSITAYRDWRNRNDRDADGMALSVSQVDTDLDHHQFSQELRLSGAATAQLDYLVGLYYLRQQLDREIGVGFGDQAAAWFLGDRPELAAVGITGPEQIPGNLLGGAQQTFDGEQAGDSRAIFGQLSWRPVDPLELTAGLRYTAERKSAWISRQVSNLSPLGPDLISQVGGPLLRNVALGSDYYRRDSISENHLSGLLGLSYRLAPQVLGYASWSRGHKAGGINLEVIGPQVQSTYDAERATSLEVGLKNRFWGERASVDLAIYQTDVNDYQALTYSQPKDALTPPPRDNLLNVGKVRLRGVELDSLWRLHERLDLRLGLAWSDARYLDFANAPCAPGSSQVSCNLDGQRLYNAPEWSGTAGLDYRHPLDAGLEAFGALDHSFRDGAYATLEGGDGSWQPAFSLTHLRAGLRRVDGGWEVEGWVRNLFDTRRITAVYALLGVGDYGVLPGEPRTLGVTVRTRY
ncbi:MAG: TonB-dependent receptor [Pseudomonas sp.]|uniref:TonB-dependent receptor n=1 Tax=Pseudomonas sp. TaxID=306 RepID=UPI0033951C0C